MITAHWIHNRGHFQAFTSFLWSQTLLYETNYFQIQLYSSMRIKMDQIRFQAEKTSYVASYYDMWNRKFLSLPWRLEVSLVRVSQRSFSHHWSYFSQSYEEVVAEGIAITKLSITIASLFLSFSKQQYLSSQVSFRYPQSRFKHLDSLWDALWVEGAVAFIIG